MHRSFWRLAALLTLPIIAAITTLPAAANHGPVRVFSATCGFSHSNFDDPILFPGQQGVAHQHDYFGNRSTNYASTNQSMAAAVTTCKNLLDKAAYWVPSLYIDGVKKKPKNVVAYYRNKSSNNDVQPFPIGFGFISATHTIFCSMPGAQQFNNPETCAQNKLTIVIDFPECWDGVQPAFPLLPSVVNSDPQTHACPPSNPIRLPQLAIWINYVNIDPINPHTYTLSSDGGGPAGASAHADFWNHWVAAEQQRLIDGCLNVSPPTTDCSV